MQLVSVKGAGAILALGKTSIYKLLRDNALERVVIGRRTLITMASIERLATPRAQREEER